MKEMISNPFRSYQVPPPAPTYFGGTLPEVVVSSDDASYPYYNELTSEERKYFNQNSPIGRAVRSIASTGKRGQTANDLREIARGVEEFGAEMTGIPGSIRFSQDPVKKLKGLGRTVEATILGSSPFITSPYNKEDVADAFDALDALGFATTTAGLAKMPLQKAANLTGRYLTQGPLRNAYRLNPIAAKQPTEVILSRVQKPGQTADLSRLDELLQKSPESLTLAEKIELAKINQPGYGRGFSSNPYDIAYYSSPGIQSSRGYVGMPEIRSIRIPAEEAARFNIRQNPVEGYLSSAPSREYLLPRNYVESSKTLTPQTFEELEQIRRLIDAETTALNTPHWWRGYPTINTPKQLPGASALDPLNAVGVTSIGGAMMRNSMRNPFKAFNLRNAYRLNPWAFKPNPEAYYRGVGKEGVEDALKTGLIRSKNTDMFRQPYFARPGEFETALYYNPEALIEAKGFDVLNLKGKGPDIDLPKLNFAKRDAGALPVTPKYAEGILGKPETKDWYFDWDVESIPVNHPDIKLLQKDWLRGYKEVSKPASGSK